MRYRRRTEQKFEMPETLGGVPCSSASLCGMQGSDGYAKSLGHVTTTEWPQASYSGLHIFGVL